MCEGIMARKGSTLIAKELNEAGYRNTVGKLWKPMDIPKFVYDCKNVGTMIINKERHFIKRLFYSGYICGCN